MSLHEEIIQITAAFLDDELNYCALSKAAKAYQDLLLGICNRDLTDPDAKSNIQMPNGMALGTFWAFKCIDDLVRTKRFIKGIEKASRRKLTEKDGKIHVVYAGTGPFAALILPLIIRLPKDRFKYTFLEINPLSFEVLRQTLEKLTLESYEINLVNDDATNYQLENDQIDIIVSETMQAGLADEQQVSIFVNLMSQVTEQTVFIPEKIELCVALKKYNWYKTSMTNSNMSQYKILDQVFEVSKEVFEPYIHVKNEVPDNIAFQEREIFIDENGLNGYDQLVMLTTVQVFEDEVIQTGESGLTTPITMINDLHGTHEGMMIKTQYQMNDESPKFRFDIKYGAFHTTTAQTS